MSRQVRGRAARERARTWKHALSAFSLMSMSQLRRSTLSKRQSCIRVATSSISAAAAAAASALAAVFRSPTSPSPPSAPPTAAGPPSAAASSSPPAADVAALCGAAPSPSPRELMAAMSSPRMSRT